MDAFFSTILLPGFARAAVALALASLAVLAARRASAGLRHRLWLLGLGAAIVLPLLAPFVPRLTRLPVPFSVGGVFTVPVPEPVWAATPTPISVPNVEPVAFEAAAPPTEPLAVSTLPAPSTAVGTVGILALVWVAGALVVLGARGMGLAARRSLRRGARPVVDAAWCELTLELRRELGITRPVVLLHAEAAAVPMTWGTLRPVVLLPKSALGWLDDRRRAVLLHELAHVRRFDAAWAGLAHLACALHWPNPLAWLAAHRLRAEAEHAADDRVLARGERPSLYAGHLLAVARALALGAAPPRPVLAMARREGSSSLAQRIGAILDGERPRSAGGRGLRLATLGLALGATLVLATVGCIRVDGLQSSLSYEDESDRPLRGYFAEERFVDQCPSGLISGQRRSIQVRGHRSGRQQIELQVRSCALEIELEGQVRLDETSILELGPGSRLSILERSGLGSRSLLVTPGSGGTPVLRYEVDGAVRPVGEEAEGFLARVILEVHRSTTIGAEDRVSRLLRSGGLAAVLAETAEISTDYVRAAYLRELLEQAQPRGAEFGQVLAAVTTLLDSDYESSQLLQAVAENAAADEELPAQYFEAVAKIESDYERSQALQKVLDRPRVSEAELAQVLVVARELDSDYERGQVLKGALARTALPEPTALAIVQSIEGLDSDYEAGQVLGTLIDKRALSTPELEAVIGATGRIGSDYERAQVLVAVARANVLSGPLLDLYVDAAESIGSEYERDRTLAAALRNRG